MAEIKKITIRQCPICGRGYSGHPALSRVDNKTEICPECGTRQALESIGVVDNGEQNHILSLQRRTRR